MPETGILTTDSSGMQRNTNSNPDANGYDPATGFTTPGSRGSPGGGGGEKGKGPPHDPAADSDSAGGEGLVQSLKNPPSSGGQQQSGSSGGQSGWSGGTNNLPPAAAPSSDASSGIPTDAGSTPAGPSPDAGAGGAGAAGMAKGGPVINPTEEPYRNKWRAKNGQKQAPYKAFADGGDTGAIPIDPDQGQEGQTGDDNLQAMQGVKAALTATRQQFGLSDKAFQMASQQLAGNIPAKPAGPGGDQPPLNPFPTKTPATPFGTKTSDSGEDNDTQSAAGGGPMYPILHTSKAAPKGPQRPANVDPTTWQDQANSRDDPGKVTPQEDDPETNIYGEDMKEIPGSGQQDPAEGGKGGRIPRGPPRADDSFGGSDSDSSGSSSGSDSGGGLSVSSARGGAIPMKSGWK